MLQTYKSINGYNFTKQKDTSRLNTAIKNNNGINQVKPLKD